MHTVVLPLPQHTNTFMLCMQYIKYMRSASQGEQRRRCRVCGQSIINFIRLDLCIRVCVWVCVYAEHTQKAYHNRWKMYQMQYVLIDSHTHTVWTGVQSNAGAVLNGRLLAYPHNMFVSHAGICEMPLTAHAPHFKAKVRTQCNIESFFAIYNSHYSSMNCFV